MKNEALESLTQLLESARLRKTEQGVLTFQGYIDRLAASNSPKEDDSIIEKMKHELAGFQRFADLTNEEDSILRQLLSR